MHRRRSALPIALFALLACRDERPGSHIYNAPPPRAASQATTAVAPSSVPTDPLRAEWPSASIVSVVDAATGSPVALNQIATPVDVIATVSRGAARTQSERVQVELRVRGVQDTTLVLEFRAPAPSIIAHAFRINVGDASPGGLRSGKYTLQIRVIAGDGSALASSVPLHAELHAHR